MSSGLSRRQKSLNPKPLFDRDLLMKSLEEKGLAVDTNVRKLWRHIIQQQLPTWNQTPHRRKGQGKKRETTSLETPNGKTVDSAVSREENGQEATPAHSDEDTREGRAALLGENATVEQLEAFQPTYRDIGLPKAMVKLLDDEFAVCTSKVVSRTDAKDGSTTKLLIELQDGKQVEAVIMRYGQVELDSFPKDELKHMVDEKTGEVQAQFKSNKRATLCVSSQVGCAMGCTFCATGTMGLVANLSAGEIIEQIYHASKVERIRNVVFMGMGEPLDNYNAVVDAINAMTDTARFGISPARISISTVGVVDKIRKLQEDAPDDGLALSLHAPTQEKRIEIVPTAKSWHIDTILDACDQFIDNQNNRIRKASKKRHILTEYVLIGDVNCSEEIAHQLGKLLQGRAVLLNVIPYNPTPIEYDYRTPSREESKEFVDIVREYGVKVLLRQTMGADVGSACGQLVVESQKKIAKRDQGCSKNKNVEDVEDIISRNTTKVSPGPGKVVRRRTTKTTKTETETEHEEKTPGVYLQTRDRVAAVIRAMEPADWAFAGAAVALVGAGIVRYLASR